MPLLLIPADVYRGQNKLGPLVPSATLEALFADDAVESAAYRHFVGRSQWAKRLQKAAFLSTAVVIYGMLTDRAWANEVGTVGGALLLGSVATSWAARRSFDAGVRRHNAQLH